MKRIYKYIILEEIKLIIQFHQNSVTIDELKLVRTQIRKDKNFNPSHKLLIDLRLSKSDIPINEVESFGKWITMNNDLTPNSLKVILTTTPNQVVYSTLFSNMEGVKELNYNICSSLSGSLKYLGIDLNEYKLVEKEIEKMIET